MRRDRTVLSMSAAIKKVLGKDHRVSQLTHVCTLHSETMRKLLANQHHILKTLERYGYHGMTAARPRIGRIKAHEHQLRL